MSYSTMLYIIDLGVLERTIGSKDLGLVERIAEMRTESVAVPKRKQLRVEVREDGAILIDGQPGDLGAAVEAYAALSDSDLCLYLCRSQERRDEALLEFSKVRVPGERSGAKIYGYPLNATETEFWADPDAVPTKRGGDPIVKALVALIKGNLDKRIKTSDYGYALERLCRLLGQRSDLDEAVADIEALGLKSPLSTARAFAQVPHDDDFPVISYLTATEVQSEASRLGRIDLAYPVDEDIENGRVALANAIGFARTQGLGVMTFYY
jgi:hypothetical protein